jgi:NADH-quinone oxidoreductase subunit D
MATVTRSTADPTVIEFDVRTDEMLVNMGPQHPSTHGVLRLVLRTDGEVISEVTPHLGYLHRCAEKIGENVTPIQFIPYTKGVRSSSITSSRAFRSITRF